MKKLSAWMFVLLLICFGFRYGNSLAFANEEEESDSSIHEMPASDNCSLIIMQIRQLVYTLNQTKRDLSSLQPPADGDKEQQQEYEQQLKALQEKEADLRHRVDLKEQQLDTCSQKPETSEDK
jgi:chromosome segregation ATPase